MKTPLSAWRSLPAEARASIAFIVSSITLKGIGFLTTPLFTRLMDTTQYGILATYTSWHSIVEVFAVLGLTSAGAFHVGLNDHAGNRDRYLSVTLTLCNVSTVLTFAVIAFLKHWLGDALPPTNLLWLMLLHFLTAPAQVFWITRHKYEHTYAAAVTVTILSALLSQTASVIGVLTIKTIPPAYVKLWCAELASLFFVIPLGILLRKRGRVLIDRKDWGSTIRLSLPLLPHYLAQYITAGADRILLASLASKAAAGIYAVVANINTITGIIWNAVNASLVPYTFERLTDGDYPRLDRTVRLLLTVFGGVCLAVCLAAPEVVALLAPPAYAAGNYAVPPLAAASFLSAVHTVFSNVEFYHKRTGRITTATVTAAVVNVVLNLFLIPHFRFLGAAYATLVSYAVLVLMHYFGYRRSSPAVYRMRYFLPLVAGGVGACLLCAFLYPYVLIRYLVIGALLVLLLLRKKILPV